MKVDFNRKYTTISVYVVLVFTICLAMVIIAINSSVIGGYISEIFRVLAPITWGIVIAFITNPIMKFIERRLVRIMAKKKPHRKLIRSLSMSLSLLIFLSILTLIISIILPQVIDSIMIIFDNASVYLDNLESSIYKFLDNYPDIVNTVEQQFETIQPRLLDFVNSMIPKIGDIALRFRDGAVFIIIGLKDFVIGIIVSVYLLLSKETFIAQCKKVVYAMFPKNVSESVLRISSHSNKTLSGFISGKLLDSLIIGILCFICLRIMNIEFVALISVIVGVTNVIPFFGPFFGAIPSALLLLVAAPKQVIPFVIFILILQQFDGNILGPMILGDSTGLSPFWVMFAIFIGGGLFGFAGMLLGVPVFAVLFTLATNFTEWMLKRRNMDTSTENYYVHDSDVPVVQGNKRHIIKFRKGKNKNENSKDTNNNK